LIDTRAVLEKLLIGHSADNAEVVDRHIWAALHSDAGYSLKPHYPSNATNVLEIQASIYQMKVIYGNEVLKDIPQLVGVQRGIAAASKLSKGVTVLSFFGVVHQGKHARKQLDAWTAESDGEYLVQLTTDVDVDSLLCIRCDTKSCLAAIVNSSVGAAKEANVRLEGEDNIVQGWENALRLVSTRQIEACEQILFSYPLLNS
jgi:hypothetical protein